MSVDICNHHTVSRHLRVERFAFPPGSAFIGAVVNKQRSSRPPVSSNNFVMAVTVQVGADKGVPVVEAPINY
ncbi:MAG TPA: hypothetical protein VGY31_05545 [Terriglobia bacterium]|nr:hypothetical protein [Terriglobia bacterium]